GRPVGGMSRYEGAAIILGGHTLQQSSARPIYVTPFETGAIIAHQDDTGWHTGVTHGSRVTTSGKLEDVMRQWDRLAEDVQQMSPARGGSDARKQAINAVVAELPADGPPSAPREARG